MIRGLTNKIANNFFFMSIVFFLYKERKPTAGKIFILDTKARMNVCKKTEADSNNGKNKIENIIPSIFARSISSRVMGEKIINGKSKQFILYE